MTMGLGGTETAITIYEHNLFLRYLPINNHLLWWFRIICNWGSGIQKSWISLEGPCVMEPGAEALGHLDQTQLRADSECRTWKGISTGTVTFIVWQRVIRWAKAKVGSLKSSSHVQPLGGKCNTWSLVGMDTSLDPTQACTSTSASPLTMLQSVFSLTGVLFDRAFATHSSLDKPSTSMSSKIIRPPVCLWVWELKGSESHKITQILLLPPP